MYRNRRKLNWGEYSSPMTIYLPHSKYSDYMKASRQETVWSKTAKKEAVDESKRSVMYQLKGYPIMASELKWDSQQAEKWSKMRKERAELLKRQAKMYKKR